MAWREVKNISSKMRKLGINIGLGEWVSLSYDSESPSLELVVKDHVKGIMEELPGGLRTLLGNPKNNLEALIDAKTSAGILKQFFADLISPYIDLFQQLRTNRRIDSRTSGMIIKTCEEFVSRLASLKLSDALWLDIAAMYREGRETCDVKLLLDSEKNRVKIFVGDRLFVDERFTEVNEICMVIRNAINTVGEMLSFVGLMRSSAHSEEDDISSEPDKKRQRK